MFCEYATARVGRVDSVTYNVNTDGSINLQCQTYVPVTARIDSEVDHHSWILDGQILTKNTDILATNPSRYNVRYQVNGPNHVYILTIPNPVQTDEGKYQCQIDYKWYGSPYSAEKHVDVTIFPSSSQLPIV